MSRTKLLGLLLATSLVATMAFGVVGSGAWFTDQATVPVSATTGEIAFDVNGADSAGITLTDLMPGVWTGQYEVNAYNTALSTDEVKYRIREGNEAQSLAGLYNLLQVRVQHTFCGTVSPATWPVVEEGPLNGFSVNSIDDAIVDYLGVNITHCYLFSFRLAPSAGNTFQNQSATFDLIFDATQPENPGWAQ
jgi:hypothetical protein